MSATPFVHLRCHTEFSLIDSIVRIDELVKTCAKQGMPAVAVTDQANLYGLVKFYKTAQGKGVKPVFGADLWVRDGDEVFDLTLLVQNDRGYRHLIEIISRGYLRGQEQGRAICQRAWVDECAEGLIALIGKRSDVGRVLLAEDTARAEQLLRSWRAVFPDRLYLELQRTGRPQDEDFVHAAVALAAATEMPVVATNDVRFLTPEEFEAHEARVCISQGAVLQDPRRPRDYSEQQYLKSPAEMIELFSDIPEAIENTLEIARRCSLGLTLGKNYLPQYPVPDGMTMEQFFRQLCHEGLEERLKALLDPAAADYAERRQVYLDRLEFEIGTILQMGFPGYFLIVMDFIRWAKENGVPVGPGRGSGAGSLVAYSLKITDLDPIKYDLLFERFLNPERVSMPDFDVDFCMDGRDRVIDYVANNYGREAVSQIITFGTMASKAVVRDVARVQGKPYGLADKMSKLIPMVQGGISLADARKEEKLLEELLSNPEDRDHDDANEIWEMAEKLEGLTRNVGKHAGGVLIAPTKLVDFTAIYCDDEGHMVSQFDKDDVEQVGLVKFDFLGLRTLTIIDWALKTINGRRAQRGEPPIDIDRIPLDDKPTYDLLQDGRTTAVFQLESTGMKGLLRKLKPSLFEDIIALVALYRPGPLESGMVDDFINRKHGREQVAYPQKDCQHESLQPVLAPTYGIILYQEQVMQIAQVLAGYSLGGADMLRRAMGKKKPEEMAKQREIFLEGATGRGIDADLANGVFDLMEKFAGYGFNKSHSAAYALVSYQTAWLKQHFPAEFMAAVLSSEMHNTDKIVPMIEECRAMGLSIVPPDVNTSEFKFTVDDRGRVVYGLGAIKGVGEGPVENVLLARAADGAFADLFDFCRRIDLKKLNKRTLEALVRAGALDKLGPHRAVLMASLDEAIQAAEQQARNADVGMVDLFGDVVDAAPAGEFVDIGAWAEDERLRAEKETLGLYLTGHPIDQYETELKKLADVRLGDLEPTRRGQPVWVCGLVLDVRVRKGDRGTRVFVLLDDRTGRVEVLLFGETYDQCRDRLQKDAVVIVECDVTQSEEYGLRVSGRKVMTMAEARAAQVRALDVTLDGGRLTGAFPADFLQLLGEYRVPEGSKGCPVRVRYRRPDAEAMLALAPTWAVLPAEDLLRKLRLRYGDTAVQLSY